MNEKIVEIGCVKIILCEYLKVNFGQYFVLDIAIKTLSDFQTKTKPDKLYLGLDIIGYIKLSICNKANFAPLSFMFVSLR